MILNFLDLKNRTINLAAVAPLCHFWFETEYAASAELVNLRAFFKNMVFPWNWSGSPRVRFQTATSIISVVTVS